MNSQTDNPINLLWTGGYDSTFRLLHLLLIEKRKVQPFYLIDQNRRSSINEIAAMTKIRNHLIRKQPDIGPLLLPTRLFLVSDIAPCQPLTDKYRSLQGLGLGTQYEWLSRFAEQHRLRDLELCSQNHQGRRRVPWAEHLYGNLVEENGISKLSSTVPDEALKIFTYFHFPVCKLTKRQMLEMAEKGGFRELLLDSWFCHHPRHGKPCGTCHPCIDAIEQGFSFRVPILSKVFYHSSRCFNKVRSLARKLLRPTPMR